MAKEKKESRKVNKRENDFSERRGPEKIIRGKVEKGSKPVIDTQPPPEPKPKEK